MKIPGFTPQISSLKNTPPGKPPQETPAPGGDQVNLGGSDPIKPPVRPDVSGTEKVSAGWAHKIGKVALKTGIIAGGLAIGGLAAFGASTIGASLGLFSLSAGLLMTLSSDPKLKAMGTLVMLGPVTGAAGLVGAIATGISVGVGVGLTGQYGAGAHQLANELLDKK